MCSSTKECTVIGALNGVRLSIKHRELLNFLKLTRHNNERLVAALKMFLHNSEIKILTSHQYYSENISKLRLRLHHSVSNALLRFNDYVYYIF